MRLTKEIVLPAIERMNRKVLRAAFVEVDSNENVCGLCPVAAVLADRLGAKVVVDALKSRGPDFSDLMLEHFGIEKDYTWGFVNGVDDNGCSSAAVSDPGRAAYHLGYSDGNVIRDELVAQSKLTPRRV